MAQKSVEETYEKLTQLQHILKRPDTYIGSIEHQSQTQWVMSRNEDEQFEFRSIEYVPGLYKIFDEILVNAADNYQRDKKMNLLKVEINQEKNYISVMNNGKGIPVQIHKEYDMQVAELIFGHLLTSSNYDDNQKKVTGGRNGYGAKLTNIFSKVFTVETADKKSGKKFKKVWRDNMSKSDEPEIVSYKEGDFTKVSFQPDLKKFRMKSLSDDIVDLMTKRVYDMAGVIGGSVKVYLNGRAIPIRGFSQYVDMYLSANQKMNQISDIIKITDNKQTNNERWEVVVALSEGQFQQVSFVNSICTIKGGTHVNHVTDQIADKLLESIKKKKEKNQGNIKSFHVKQHLWVFVNSMIENPSFDSQTKETLTLKPSAFGSTCDVGDKLVKDLLKAGIAKHVLLQANAKEQAKMAKQLSGKKQQRLLGIPKLEDANDAGTRNADQCTLILTEGDSAKSLAMAGIEIVGRDRYGVFPLRGKMLNVRDSKTSAITSNAEIQNIMKIMGLKIGTKYTDTKSLRYGSIMIMADQDTDGSHIKGLFVNFIQHFWPSLYKMPGFLRSFITPLIKAKKGNQVHAFYTVQDFQEWLQQQANPNTWTFKYYKGLGTSTSKEGQEYFKRLNTHIINFKYQNELDDEAIDLAFNKKKADDRKQWLAEYDPKVCVDYTEKNLRYRDYVNKELIQFSMADNARSIPSIADGLKTGQRKILYSCFKRNLKSEIKVAQLSGYVAEHSAYHHGEMSLAQTIIGMAQNFVGTNNINFLMPNGQFGGRNMGGKEAASARYIYTNLNKITRVIFNEHDDHILNYLEDDGQTVEPEFYQPIIPTILVNGGDGIGTGWSTNIPQYNPRELVQAIRDKINIDSDFQELIPWYKGFTGEILPQQGNGGGFLIKGNYEIKSEDTIAITEIPLKKWTRDYKNYLEEMMNPKDKDGKDLPAEIKDIREYHKGNRVYFQIQMTDKGMAQMKDNDAIEKFFKLSTTMQTTNLVLFDHDGKLKKFNGINEIIHGYYYKRLGAYDKRKEYLISKIQRDLEIYQNKKRFILAVINEQIQIRNVKKTILVEELQKKGFKKMKDMTKIKSTKLQKNVFNEQDGDNSDNQETGDAKEFNYLLSMPMWSLTYEKVEELKKLVAEKEDELSTLRMTTIQDMWLKDLDRFEEVLDEIEDAEENEIRQQMGLKSNAPRVQNKTIKKPQQKKKQMMDIESDDYDQYGQESDFDSEEEYGNKKKKKGGKKGSKNSQETNKLDGMKVSLSQETGISSRISRREFAPMPNSQPQASKNSQQQSQKPKKSSKQSEKEDEQQLKRQRQLEEQEREEREREEEEKRKKEEEEKNSQPNSMLSSIFKYLNPGMASQASVFSQPQQNNSQGAGGVDNSQLSLEERLMKKESEGKFKSFESAYNQVKESPGKPSLETIKKDSVKENNTENNNYIDDEIQNILDNASDNEEEFEKENKQSQSNKQTNGKRKGNELKSQPKKKTKKNQISDSEDDDGLDNFVVSDSEESYGVSKKKTTNNKKKQSQTNSQKAKKDPKAPAKKLQKKKKTIESEDEDDIQIDLEEDSLEVKKPSKSSKKSTNTQSQSQKPKKSKKNDDDFDLEGMDAGNIVSGKRERRQRQTQKYTYSDEEDDNFGEEQEDKSESEGQQSDFDDEECCF